MLVSKSAIVKWGSKNKKHYIDAGYIFTKIGDEFEVDVKDLQTSASCIVDVKCDYCGTIITTTYNSYSRAHHNTCGDACKKCGTAKREKIMIEEKGVRCAFELDEVKEKSKQTMMAKYGVEYSMQSEDIKEKSKMRCMEKYGCEYAMQSSEILSKRNETWNKKYGGHPMSTESVMNKRIETTFNKYGVAWITQTDLFKEQSSKKCMDRYGVQNFGQVKELHIKGIETMCKNGTLPISKPESMLVDMLIDMYGSQCCTPSKVLDWYILDCEVVIDGIKIDVEYDGLHWHCDSEEQRKRDNVRNGYMKYNGYKILRVMSKKSIPTKLQIEEAMCKLLNTDANIAYIYV